MRIIAKNFALAVLVGVPSCAAFSVHTNAAPQIFSTSIQDRTGIRLFAAETDAEKQQQQETSSSSKDTDTDNDTDTVQARVKEGSHAELMYALGVNLARQLGDVRPRKFASRHLNVVSTVNEAIQLFQRVILETMEGKKSVGMQKSHKEWSILCCAHS